MRGAHDVQAGMRIDPRIIPADAGSALALPRSRGPCRDHPRRCGEHLYEQGAEGVNKGSSPQMRGAPWVAWSTLTVIWIIPADAGSTIERIIMTYEIKDHPRRCGEH